jgi:hypothetical protein
MVRVKLTLGPAAPWLLLALGSLPAGGGTGTATETLSATLSPVGALTTPATATLSKSLTSFQPFTASVPVNYQVRTTPGGTGGTITLKVASDFSPSGGPTAASGALTYVCSGANLGTACSGTQTASTTTSTPVLTVPASACTGGGGACSSQNPNSMSLTFTLIDSPVYPTGTYSANVTFTISAM